MMLIVMIKPKKGRHDSDDYTQPKVRHCEPALEQRPGHGQRGPGELGFGESESGLWDAHLIRVKVVINKRGDN